MKINVEIESARSLLLLLAVGVVMGWSGCHKPQAIGEAGMGDRAYQISELEWLVGGWASEGEGEQTSEQWVRAHPRLMLGSNRTVRDGELANYEHVEIWARGGQLVYRAKPADQPAAEFVLTELEDQMAVFESPDHDFPQRIVYRRLGNSLEASVHGEVDGAPAEHTWTWELRRDQARPDDIVKTTSVQASPERVFAAFTDQELVTTFFAPAARIEARPDGVYEMYFIPEAPEGDRGGEGCTVVALEPPHSVSFTWNFPPSIPTLRDAHTLVTVRIDPQADGTTRIELEQQGFRSGADWDEGRAYFDRAWDVVLERLEQRFATGPIDWGTPAS